MSFIARSSCLAAATKRRACLRASSSAPVSAIRSQTSAADASSLYARNVLDYLKLVLPKEGGLKIDLEDDIVLACRMAQDGQVTKK